MEPIEDFELLFLDETSRFGYLPESERQPIPDRPAPGKHLRIFDVWMDDYWFRPLLYRGRPIPHLGLIGTSILGQFETEHGYLIFTGNNVNRESYELPGPRRTTIAVYLILPDFSGAEWAMAPVKLAPRDAAPPSDDSHQRPKQVVSNFRIVDNHRLDFRVDGTARFYWIWYPFGIIPVPPFGKPIRAAKGVYRVTLSDAQPKRFCFGAPEFERPNSSYWTARYFKITRLPRPTPH